MSRVRPSYNPRAPLNHYPPPSQESNERTMGGSECAARKGSDEGRGGDGEREREGGDKMEWRLLIENEQENGKKEKKKENKHTGRRTTLTRTVAAADLHTGEGCRSRVEGKERTRQGSQLAQAGAVEFSTVIGTSLCMLQHHHHQHHLHGEPPGIHRGLSRDGLKMYVSSYPFASFAFSSHLAIHPHIHPSMNPSAPLRSRRPAQRIYIIAVMLRFSGWATRSGHHRQNYLPP